MSSHHLLANSSDSEDGDIESPSSVTAAFTTAPELFEQHPTDAIKTVQVKGMISCGKFEIEDTLVLQAFKDKPLISQGSNTLHEDWKEVWEKHLRSKYASQKKSGILRSKPPKQQFINYIGMEAFCVAIKDAAAVEDAGLLRPLLHRLKARRCSAAVMSLSAVKAVTDFKWTTYARRLMILELGFYCLWVVGFIVFIAALHESSWLPLSHHWRTWGGGAVLGAELTALVGMAPFVGIDLSSMQTWGASWLFDPSHVANALTVVLQLAIAVVHLGSLDNGTLFHMLLATQCILLLFRGMHLTQSLKSTPISFLTVLGQVMKDVSWVFLFILLTMIAFGAAFFITLHDDASRTEEYETMLRSMLAMFEHVYGDLQIKDFYNSSVNPVFATLLAIIYMIFMGFVLVNLLIGVVINSLDQIMDREGINQAACQVQLIDDIDGSLPRWLDRREWHPTYIYVLRVDASKLDDVDADAMAANKGEFAPEVLQGARREELGDAEQQYEEEVEEEGAGPQEQQQQSEMEAVRQEVQAVRQQLEQQGVLLQRLSEMLLKDKSH